MGQQWLEFLFGDVRRTVRTAILSFVLLLIVSQDVRIWLEYQIADLAGRMMVPVLLLAIILYALRRMLGPLFPTGGNNRRH